MAEALATAAGLVGVAVESGVGAVGQAVAGRVAGV